MKRYALPLLPGAPPGHLAFRRAAACLFILCILSAAQIKAQTTAETGSIDGYWELTTEFLDYDLNTTVRFKVAGDSQTVEGIALGPASGRDASFIGKISSNRLSLKAQGPAGQMQVDLTLSGGNLSGSWTSGKLNGSVRGTRLTSRKPEPSYYPKYLKTVCQLIRDNFYDPQLKGVEIEKLREKYAAQLPEVKDDADFVKLIRSMLDEFETSHLDFYLAPKDSPLKEKAPLIAWRKISSQAYYLRIRNFDPISPQDQQNYYRLLEKAVEEIRDSPSVVIDLRGNRGGNLAVALRSLAPFLRPGEDMVYAFARAGAGKAGSIPAGAKKDNPGLPVVAAMSPEIIGEIVRNGASVIRLDAEPKKIYRGKIVILIDEQCYSGCELFSAILQEKGRATLIGKRTGGEALGSFTDSLIKNMVVMKKDTGWRLEIPIIDFRTIGGKRIEGQGVRPDIEITSPGEADAFLAEALRYLGQASASRK